MNSFRFLSGGRRAASANCLILLSFLASTALLPALALLPARPAFAAAGEHQDRNAADPTVDVVADGKGRINYAAGIIKATGYGATPASAHSPAQGRLMALGAAKADALRNLAMTVSSIQVTATTKVKNYELQSDVVQTKLSALLSSPRVASESYQPDGTAVVVVELSLYGRNSVAAAVLPEVLSANRPDQSGAVGETVVPVPVAPPIAGDLSRGAGANAQGVFVGPAEPAVRITPAAIRPAHGTKAVREPGLTPAGDSGPFTSVIIDCRGLGIEAIMSPKLMDTTGREIYGTVRVTPEYAIETGIVGYPRSMTEALLTARCGDHPLIVRGLRVADKYHFNPVVSAEDGDRILAADNRDRFLEQTRVIFLVDPLR